MEPFSELLLLPEAEPLLDADRSLVCSTVVTFRILFGTKGCLVLLIVLALLLLEDGGRFVVAALSLLSDAGGLVVDML